MAQNRWLRAVIACASPDDADAVRRVLHRRGARTRSVPVGGARVAWTAPAPAGLVGVVLTRAGPDGAKPAARFWAPRAGAVVVAGTGGGTGLAGVGGVVLDGDPEMRRIARREAEAAEILVVDGSVGGVAGAPRSEEARRSLVAAGVAATDSTLETWRAAARTAGTPLLACRAIPNPPGSVADAAASDEGAPSRLRAWLRLVRRPGDGERNREADEAARPARRAAARLAVAAAGVTAGVPASR